MFEPKPISPEAVPAALEKADRYRLLNDPEGAESICRDILRVEPGHQGALIALILSLTDQLGQRMNQVASQARDLLPQLENEYHRAYYEGIFWERRAKAKLRRGGPGSGYVAYDWFRQAMEAYERAAERRPEGEDASILRWNTCARLIERHPDLMPEPESRAEHMLE